MRLEGASTDTPIFFLFAYNLTVSMDPNYDEVILQTFEGSVRAFGTAIPEPSTLALLGLGVLGVAAWRRRRRDE